MALKDLNLRYKYRSDANQLINDFYINCLMNSNRYDRAVGYFSSSSLPLIAKGLEYFIEKKGKIRIICNPLLSEDDIEAISNGIIDKEEAVYNSILKQIKLSEEDIKNDPLNTLAWLISMNLLELKIAYTNNNSIYHEKFGLFYDEEGTSIAFSGSANETYSGLTGNFEKVDVYFRESEKDRIYDSINDFELLWNNRTNGLKVVPFTKVLIKEIMASKKDSPPKAIRCVTSTVEIREYQQYAVDELLKNNWSGIFNMATGTGKTITSIFAVEEFYNVKKSVFLVVLVPYKHLVSQWEKTLNLFGVKDIIKCFDSKIKWIDNLRSSITDYNIGLVSRKCVIAVYDTASKEEFQECISSIKRETFLIADECHNFGVTRMKNHRFWTFTAKLGLSATPDRWWDEEGTERISTFFNKTVYEYSLEQAISDGKLVNYEYVPVVIDLIDDEIDKYDKITSKIIKLTFDKSMENEEYIKRLMLERSLIVSKAANKKTALINIFEEKKVNDIRHTLVYCAPGEVNEITYLLHRLGIRVHRFDSKVNNKRRSELLEQFSDGSIQVLVAIRCLDEGVDVPNTKEAYFLASTTNPREFIQRRGRILRPSENKTLAKIVDFIVLPCNSNQELFTSIASKEMPRFAEFSRCSINKYIAREEIYSILSRYDLEYLMDKLPWEVYSEMKSRYGGTDEN